MSTVKLDFTNSEYFVAEDGNWHLKDGAPEEIKEEFEEYMRYTKECEDKGIFI